MSVKNCLIKEKLDEQETTTNAINATVNTNSNNILALDNAIQQIGLRYGLPVPLWSVQNAGIYPVPQNIGTWINIFDNHDFHLPTSGTYMATLNFVALTHSTDNHTISVGCELLNSQAQLFTNFQGSSRISTVPITGTNTDFDSYFGFGVSMSFPLNIVDPTEALTLNLYFNISTTDDTDLRIASSFPNSTDNWWKSSINMLSSGFDMTLLSASD